MMSNPFTDDEEAVLIAMHEHSGNKWTLISKQLPGRSDNDVKVMNLSSYFTLLPTFILTVFPKPMKDQYHSTIKRKFDLHGQRKLINAAIEHVSAVCQVCLFF